MEPTTTVLLLQALIKYGPEVFLSVKRILASPAPPTEADWKSLVDLINNPLYSKA